LIPSQHQYLLLSAPPAKEKLFQTLKAKHGATYAFHGSRAENWHSILRRGLVNASGTKLQLNGAAHGSGVYVSPSFSFAAGYCRGATGSFPRRAQGAGANRFLEYQDMTCIALCEVIVGKYRNASSGSIWVVPDASHVITRFFFVLDGRSQADVSCSDSRLKEQVERAMKLQGL